MKHFFLFFVLILIPSVVFAQKQINIRDYGVTPGEQDATPGLLQALEDCRKFVGAELIFPQGEYHFYPDYGIDRYCFISNNDEGLKRIIFPLFNFHGLVINGQGSSFIFHGFVNPFVVDNSSDILFDNFSVDYTRTFHSEAIILANHSEGIDVTIPLEFPYCIRNGVLLFTDGSKEEKTKTTVSKDVIYPYTSLLEFDIRKRETAFMAKDYFLNNIPLIAQELGENKVRIFLNGLKGTVGNIMTFGAGTRNYPGFVISDSKDVQLKNITIHHTGGMGVVGQRSHNISLDSCTVSPSEGRIISCTADATHFTNCTGKIELSHCLFENQKDDATNIHGIYVRIEKMIGPNEIVVGLKHNQQFGFDFLKPGVEVECVKATNLITKGHVTIVAVQKINKEYTRVKLEQHLPEGIGIGDVIGLANGFANVHIHHNVIRNNRARGMLLNCRGTTIIENNYFHTPGAAIMFEGDASFWYEQGGVRNCIIRNNIFDNCLFGIWGEAVIDVQASILKDRNTSRYNKNIRIEKNTFRIFDNILLLNIFAVDNLIWANNIIERNTDYCALRKRKSLFKIEYSDNIHIEQ